MENGNKRLSFAEARATDIVAFLKTIGHEPVKIRGVDFWYFSPLRQEQTASFKVNTRMNRWYDFGLGRGGSFIDFGMAFYQCGLNAFMDRLAEGNLNIVQKALAIDLAPSEPAITIEEVRPLTHPVLLRYLAVRHIPSTLACRYCVELAYSLHGKSYFGIGFANDFGGYEIRNPYFKSGSAPKGYTSIVTGSRSLNVFEGFIDFLSFEVLFAKHSKAQDTLVLNSLSFLHIAREVMDGYDMVNLYFDHDNAGQRATAEALAFGEQYQDKSQLYCGCEDLNDFLCKKMGLLQSSRQGKSRSP